MLQIQETFYRLVCDAYTAYTSVLCGAYTAHTSAVCGAYTAHTSVVCGAATYSPWQCSVVHLQPRPVCGEMYNKIKAQIQLV